MEIIRELSGPQARHPGGHNWPDLEIVFDPTQTEIESGLIYLVTIHGGLRGDHVVKKLVRRDGSMSIYAHPALSAIHDAKMVEIFGKRIPCQTIEFSDSYSEQHIEVHGRVIGLWAGEQKAA